MDQAASPETMNAGMMAMVMAFMMAYMLVIIVVYAVGALSQMLIAKKMGIANSWLAWIPIGNIYLFTQMAGRPWWWLLLFLVPCVGLIIGLVLYIIMWIDILKKLNKNPWMVLVVLFFGIIYLPILAFSKK